MQFEKPSLLDKVADKALKNINASATLDDVKSSVDKLNENIIRLINLTDANNTFSERKYTFRSFNLVAGTLNSTLFTPPVGYRIRIFNMCFSAYVEALATATDIDIFTSANSKFGGGGLKILEAVALTPTNRIAVYDFSTPVELNIDEGIVYSNFGALLGNESVQLNMFFEIIKDFKSERLKNY